MHVGFTANKDNTERRMNC